jgi:allantoinase
MPLNSIPPTTTVENLTIKRNAAHGQCWTDVGFWGGVIPENEVNLKSGASRLDEKSLNYLKDHLVPLVEAGVRGFKCIMIESGVEVCD